MKTFSVAAVIAFAVASTAVGCADKKTTAANKQLWQENRELKAQLDETKARLTSTETDLATKDARLSELESSLKTPEPGQDPAIAGVETSYDPKTKTLTVNLPGDVLFASGTSNLKKNALPTLDKIVTALKADYAGKKVEVKGHTDSDPVVKTKKIYQDNLELSLERAATVTRYLASKGVDPKLVKTTGFAENAPRDDKNKSLNRRVEISVVME